VPFSDDSLVDVRELDDKEWETLCALEYEGERDRFLVPVGQHTDFASVPRVFAWFIPPYGAYTRAAILHDYLWRQGVPHHELEWIDADAILPRAMRELGVPFLRRWIMWAAVRWGALTRPRGTHRWWKEAPRVLLFTAFALPFVLPPALVITVSLALYELVEFLLWVPLKVSERIRGGGRRPAPKQVNRPMLSWKL
jgi:hypothetical protein